MSRRNRKKKQTSSLDDIKGSLGSLDKERLTGFWYGLPNFHRRALMVLVPLFLILLVVPFPESGETSQPVAEPKPTERVTVSVNTDSLSQQREEGKKVVNTKGWKEYTVQSGDTLAKVFRSNQLPMTDLNALVAIEGLDKPLSKIKQGQLIRYKLTSEGNVDILQLEKQGTSVMFFRLSEGGFGRSK
ncbi:lysine transporter LysM [Vibrio sp. JC009]|uniref:LysM-like peptidoglycan-binding domain-containing protein n=1 Tax=Vibrio sp. JC009 TaxID=2912314 RepID=UPI0023B061BB|nr:LysM-like peptidoglycan-binding domain-containing protein [Vibrio sp. JC009]WED22117.1 lysine transporter LysM [Vibrio sp. JC009]